MIDFLEDTAISLLRLLLRCLAYGAYFGGQIFSSDKLPGEVQVIQILFVVLSVSSLLVLMCPYRLRSRWQCLSLTVFPQQASCWRPSQ
jgi:hypothetical protein